MKKIVVFLLCLASFTSLPVDAQDYFSHHPGLPDCVLFHAAGRRTLTDEEARLSFILPTYFIYPDGPVGNEQAKAIIDVIGLDGALSAYTGNIMIINPSAGDDYSDEADFKVYETIFNTLRVFVNLKVIGIGKGATFVNRVIAPAAGEVAGIVSIGGAASSKAVAGATVPAYIAGRNASKAAKAYIDRNNARRIEGDKNRKVYINAEEPLLKVVVNTSKNAGLKELFADAWESVLSQNYRSSNWGHTNYMGALLGQYGEYELEPYPLFDRLGIRRVICAKQITPRSKQIVANYLWYEYIPSSAESVPERTVPLVVLLHGHSNDPRTQAETGGFLELCAKERFIIAELEWQGKNEFNYMDDDGIEVTVREILRRYPQIDPSRIYVEGLSAGAFAATAIGIKKPYLFAAVGAHSGGLFTREVTLGFPFQEPDGIWQAASFLRGKTTTPYFCISGTVDEVVPFPNSGSPNGMLLFNAWKLYHHVNGLSMQDAPDTEKYPIFGIPLQNRRRVGTNKRHDMDMGDVLVNGLPVIRIVAVENFGHGNFVPGAQQMWDFFRHWSRDQVTFQPVWTD